MEMTNRIQNPVSGVFRRGAIGILLAALMVATGCASGPRYDDEARFVGPEIGNPLFGGFRIESEFGNGGWQHYLVVRKDDDVYPGLAPRAYNRANVSGYDVDIVQMAEAFTHCPGPCARHYEIIVPLTLDDLDAAARGAGLPVRLFAQGCDCPPLDVWVGPDYARDYLYGLDRHYG